MVRFKPNNKHFFASALLLFYLVVTPVYANQHLANALQRLNAFRRRVFVDVQTALAKQNRTLHSANEFAEQIDDAINMSEIRATEEIKRLKEMLDESNSKLKNAQIQLQNHRTLQHHSADEFAEKTDDEIKNSELRAIEEIERLQEMLDESNSKLKNAQIQLQNHELHAKSVIALNVQIESDLWRAKYSRLLKEQSIKTASLEHVKKENVEIKQEIRRLQQKLQQLESEKMSAESMYFATKQELDSLREQSSIVHAVSSGALENAWIGRQDAESELMVLKSKQHVLMEEMDRFRGNATLSDAAKDKALESAWTVLQETMDELAVVHRLAEQLRREKDSQKEELQRNLESEVNTWEQDYAKLMQSQSIVVTELDHVLSDNRALREELEKHLGQSRMVDAVKDKALENAWIGRKDGLRQLVFASQFIHAMRKQIDELRELADQRKLEVVQVTKGASRLAQQNKDFESEASSKQAALLEQNKELESKASTLQKVLDEKTIEYQESVHNRLLEAEDNWWKKLSLVKKQRGNNILSIKNVEIAKLNKDIEIMCSDVVSLRVENERLVARLDERHGDMARLSSGAESLARAHEDFKISTEQRIDYLNQRASESQARLDRKEDELGNLRALLNSSSDECATLLRERTETLDIDCQAMLLDRESQSQRQVSAASNATMAAIDAVQQDLRYAYEQLYHKTELNSRLEAKIISEDRHLKQCSKSVEGIMREKDALIEQHKMHLQQVASEVDELWVILEEKNDELALLQTTLGEKVDETELLVEKTAFETAAKWQQNILQVQADCQTRCSREADLEETQEILRNTTNALEASNHISRNLRESLDHCRLESGQLSETSSRLAKLNERYQRQITESEIRFKMNIEELEASDINKVEIVAADLLVCQDKLKEAGSECAKSLTSTQLECQKEVESERNLAERAIAAAKNTFKIDCEKQLNVAAAALEKADHRISECRHDLDRLSFAAQGLSKFQMIVDERATEVQNAVSAELDIVKAELDQKDQHVKDLTRQIHIETAEYDDRIREMEESCIQKLSWLENSNRVKNQSLEESRDSALHALQLCSDERSDVKSEVTRLRSVVTEISEENGTLNLKYQQKQNEALEMNTQLLQTDDLMKSIQSAVVSQNDEMKKECINAIKAVEEQKEMEIQNEQERCSKKFNDFSDSHTLMSNNSKNCGIKVEAEYSMTQKLWTMLGQNSQAFDEQRLNAAIEHRTIEWKRKFQHLEEKSTALLRQTEEALLVCYNYTNNLTAELRESCQTSLNQQETRLNELLVSKHSSLENEAREKRRLAIELNGVEADLASTIEQMKQCSKSIEELYADKENMSGTIVKLRSDHDALLVTANTMEDQLLLTLDGLQQKKMDAEYWRDVYEKRSYFNFSHVQDSQIIIHEARKYYHFMLESFRKLLRPCISLALELWHRAEAVTGPIFRPFVHVYDEHARSHVNTLIGAGRASYEKVVTPLLHKLDFLLRAMLINTRLALKSLLDRFAIQLSRSCRPVISQLDQLANRTNHRLPIAAKDTFEALCVDPIMTLTLISMILGVVCIFVLRRPLLHLSLGASRFLIWAVRLLLSVTCAPFLFMFRFPMILFGQLSPIMSRLTLRGKGIILNGQNKIKEIIS